MLSEHEKPIFDVLDEAAERAGGYVARPKRPLVMDYDYPAMSKYCHERGICNTDLTEDELKLFEYEKPLVYM